MIISIEGNIGAGKSTILRELKKQGYNVRFEQIEEWPLDDFYKDPKRWAMTLQLAILKTLTYPTVDFVIYERSPLSAMYVFWDMLFDKGIVTDVEDQLLWYYVGQKMWTPDVTIYIDTPVEQCFANVQRRGQVGDESITLDYLKDVEKYYKKIPVSHRVQMGSDVVKVVKDIIDKYK